MFMRKSARILGQEYGLTAQEMNFVLKEEGYLRGEAGEYTITDKGKPYAEEKDFHRGTGGYAHYNRDWTTRVWDESIKDELNVTSDKKEAARKAVAEKRRQHGYDIKAARAEADAAFLERYNQKDEKNNVSDAPSEDDSNLLKSVLIIGGLIVLCISAYKAFPHVVKWWKGSVAPILIGKNAVKKMICPSCGDTMNLDYRTAVWKCDVCKYSISEKL